MSPFNLLFIILVLGKIQSAVGKTKLLINQKFEQFRQLCNKNLEDKLNNNNNGGNCNSNGSFVTLDQDLAGFWDMVCIQIDHIQNMYIELDGIRDNNWKLLDLNHHTHGDNSNNLKTMTTTTTNNKSNKITKTVNGTTTSSNNNNNKKVIKPSNTTTTTTTNNNSNSKVSEARKRLMEAKRNALKQQQSNNYLETINGGEIGGGIATLNDDDNVNIVIFEKKE